MSVPNDRQSFELQPLLRPYHGAGGTWLQRHAKVVVACIAALFCMFYGFYYALTTPWLLVPFLVPLAILMMIVIWAAPETKTVPIRTLERLFFALFIGLIVWPNYLAISLPGLPWITVSRLIGTPLALLFLLSLSSNSEFRKKLGEILNASPVFWKAFAILLFLMVASLPVATHVGASVSRLVVVQMTQTCTLLLSCYLFVRPGRARYAAFVLWGLALMVSAFALLEAPLHHTLWAGHIPSFLKIENEVVARIVAGNIRNTTGQYRVQSVFSTPLGLSEYLGLVSPFILYFAFSRTSKVWVRIASGATLGLLLLVILGTDSRFGLMVYFLAAMAYLLSWALLKMRSERSLIGTAIVWAYPVIFALGVVASFVIGRVRAKVWGTGQYNDSTAARVDQFNLAYPKMLTHPIGYGLANGAEAIGYHTPSGLLSVDSYYLALTMELGIFGLIAFLTMFIYLGLRAFMVILKSYDQDGELSLILPAAISIAVFLVIKIVFAQEDNHPVIYVLAGMIVALLYRYDRRDALAASSPPAHDMSAVVARLPERMRVL